MAMQMCCQLIKYSRFEGSISLSLTVMLSANGAVPEKSRCSPSHFKTLQAVKYATLPRPLLYVRSNVICGIDFFIGSSDREILLLCVAEEWLQFRRDKVTFLYIVEFARIILGVAGGNFHI